MYLSTLKQKTTIVTNLLAFLGVVLWDANLVGIALECCNRGTDSNLHLDFVPRLCAGI